MYLYELGKQLPAVQGKKKEKMAANWRDNKLQHWDYIIILLKEKRVCGGGNRSCKGIWKALKTVWEYLGEIRVKRV